ncbi:MAG TPA: sensor domain-containing diguanylate cyclase [Acidimicrobiales bacterium]|nr:sensor domain-containing diguanylate cyclase [Acidimicrobiales bacterium]
MQSIVGDTAEREGNNDAAVFVPAPSALAWLKERASQHRRDGTITAGVTVPVDDVDDTEGLGLFGVVLRGSLDSIILNDRETEWILEVSDSFETLTGYGRNELIGRTSLELGLVDRDEVRTRSSAQAHAGIEGTYEAPLRRKGGGRLWVEYSQQIIGDQYVLTILRDVSDRKRLETDLRALADFDELTGIYNRRRFQEEVEKHLTASRRFGDPMTLMLLDVDAFKQINDTYGHHTGDRALQVVAGALRNAVRETDLVGRLGGDEFVALLTRADDTGIDRVIGAFRRALQFEDEASGTSFSIEVTIGTARSQAGDTCDSLMRRADRAMYAEKNKKYA